MVFPTKDVDTNPMTCEFGLCKYSDFQKIVLQELPEESPSGLIPRSVSVILQDDLCGKYKPGDKVFITGLYKNIGGKTMKSEGIKFTSVLIATNIEYINYTSENNINISTEDVTHIKEEANNRNIIGNLASSIGPFIQGRDLIKKALLLMLMGGTEITMENGSHLRGDINILLCGDPGCGKSQLLRAMMNLAPNCVNTTGKGSSGVGLTAAIISDKDTGTRHVEGGAMVLADRGLLCIDEFDKLDENDRVAIHEAMEQQTVTLAKAGIHIVLNTRCSVLAASNPIDSS